MSRMRLALLASAVGLSSAVAVIAVSGPAVADTSLIVKYHCVGGVAGALGVDVEAAVTPKVEPGPKLRIDWALTYLGQRRFGSPGYFAAGSQLNLQGTVNLTGAWNGELRPASTTAQDALKPGDFLKAPAGLSDAGSIEKTGTIRITPTGLAVRFTPAEGEVMVNNNEAPPVKYTGTWWHKGPQRGIEDHLNDVQETATKDASAKLTFVGTQVTYVGRRAPGLSPIKVLLDGQPVTDPLVEPGKDESGEPMTGTTAKQDLWTSPELEYGEHTIEVINTQDGTAFLDAFRVKTGKVLNPPQHDEATCTPIGTVNSIDITVTGASPSPTSTPTGTGTPTSTPTSTATSTPTSTATTTPPTTGGRNPNIQAPEHVIVNHGGRESTSTGTPTPTAGPTATKYVKAQVRKVPTGGVASGEAPETPLEPYLLLGGGAMLLFSSTAGGLMLRRRRAAQAKEVSA
ncbi:hypothetical protein [Nonomuraea soli]|uniref:LPXTG cell wall anchor domain-containing protein n=1 Tax=Nonomuraea soli TaxID=1032476 RepID=A0A7W0CTJ7_9ACTN|nr:hypothetical protein [Nonomuraea soli]MBA2897092.1 hypothetical protein [Nonomuraea soli]